MVIKISIYIVAMEQHLIKEVHGILVMRARNVIIFGVDNSLSSHTDNCKSHFFSVKWRTY